MDGSFVMDGMLLDDFDESPILNNGASLKDASGIEDRDGIALSVGIIDGRDVSDGSRVCDGDGDASRSTFSTVPWLIDPIAIVGSRCPLGNFVTKGRNDFGAKIFGETVGVCNLDVVPIEGIVVNEGDAVGVNVHISKERQIPSHGASVQFLNCIRIPLHVSESSPQFPSMTAKDALTPMYIGARPDKMTLSRNSESIN